MNSLKDACRLACQLALEGNKPYFFSAFGPGDTRQVQAAAGLGLLVGYIVSLSRQSRND